jgi:hypothetical protein
MSPVHAHPSTFHANEKAVITSLYSDSYAVAVATLGHSLIKVNTTARKIAIYLPERIDPDVLCRVKAAGWEMHPVEYIPPAHGGKGIYWHFADQYTKLRIWTLDQIGIKSAVYLDADTLAKNNFDELFDIPFEFAAVPDAYPENGFTLGFNAGVMVLKPNTTVFEDMMSKVEGAKYKLKEAEQAYLNVYFGKQTVRLPHMYNGNLAIKGLSTSYWAAMQENLKIMHYTLFKPFDGLPKCTGMNCTAQEIFNRQKQREHVAQVREESGGLFRGEMDWWLTVYEEMMDETGGTCV